MSRFDCLCGFEIRDISYPPTHTGHLVTYMERDDGAVEVVSDVHRCRSVIECPECWRIWIQIVPGQNKYAPYKPEKEPIKLSAQQGGYRG
jgi:hypothetical protein